MHDIDFYNLEAETTKEGSLLRHEAHDDLIYKEGRLFDIYFLTLMSILEPAKRLAASQHFTRFNLGPTFN